MQAELEPTVAAVAAEPVLEVRNLTKHFTLSGGFLPWKHRRILHAVDDVSFSLSPGRITALVGESGSGKSTVARLIALLYPATSGAILFEGHEAGSRHGTGGAKGYRAAVQMISQDPFASLNPVKRVDYNIKRPLKIHSIVARNQIDARVRELLETVGLVPATEVARKFPHQLSGGQRQRVSIARALAVEPRVMIADEPTSMLDVSIRMGILNLLLDLKRTRNLAVLFITHDIASAHYVADDIMVMYAGQIVEQGGSDQVLSNPLHPYTRLLLSAIPDPEKAGQGIRIEAAGEARAAVDPPDMCRFAPRCPVAVDASWCRNPDLLEVESGHFVRCHRYQGDGRLDLPRPDSTISEASIHGNS